MKKMYNFKLALIFMVAGTFLFLEINTGFALEKEELEKLNRQIEILSKDDPDLAKAVKEELNDAIDKGEIELPERKDSSEQGSRDYSSRDLNKIETEARQLAESGKTPKEVEAIIRERYGDPEGPGDFERPDLTTEEGKKEALEQFSQEKDNLLKEGFTKDEIKEIEDRITKGEDPKEIFEKHFDLDRGPGQGRGPGDIDRGRGPMDYDRGRGPGDFERGPREPGREFNKEVLEKEFTREMGREPTDKEREMMDKEIERYRDFDKEREFGGRDREMMGRDREMIDKEFEREMGREPTEREREMMEREVDREREFDHVFEREFDREPPPGDRFEPPPPQPPEPPRPPEPPK